MNLRIPFTPWRDTTHFEKVDLIIGAYGKGHVTSIDIASHLSGYLNCKLCKDHITSVYRINKRNNGKLQDYPLSFAPIGRKKPLGVDLDVAVKLWCQGMTGNEVAEELGITRSQLYTLVENHRSIFPRRAGVGRPTNQPTPTFSITKHSDRVTRMTNGWPITLRRVTFIDGAPTNGQ